MTIQDILLYINTSEISSLTSFAVIVIVVVSSLIEISPIKVNPWSWVVKKLGDVLNREVIKELQDVKKDVCELKVARNEAKREREDSKATAARRRILNFDDELRRGVQHSQEQFRQIIEDDIDFYKGYCNCHPDYPNNMAENAMHNIVEKHRIVKEKNDFI